MRAVFLLALLCMPGAAVAQGYGGPAVRAYGGKDGKTLLGCITCDASFSDSIFNPTGAFGQCPGSTDYDGFSLFCSRWSNSDLNPCAKDARTPPALVDDAGRYLGRFSIGGEHGHEDSVCQSTSVYQSAQACRLIRDLCNVHRIVRANYPVDPPRVLDLGPCMTDRKVAAIAQQGKYVKLDDDSYYLISPTDQRVVISTWFMGDDVLLCAGERMANPKRRVTVSASRTNAPQ